MYQNLHKSMKDFKFVKYNRSELIVSNDLLKIRKKKDDKKYNYAATQTLKEIIGSENLNVQISFELFNFNRSNSVTVGLALDKNALQSEENIWDKIGIFGIDSNGEKVKTLNEGNQDYLKNYV